MRVYSIALSINGSVNNVLIRMYFSEKYIDNAPNLCLSFSMLSGIVFKILSWIIDLLRSVISLLRTLNETFNICSKAKMV
jgi:hypothetical protein